MPYLAESRIYAAQAYGEKRKNPSDLEVFFAMKKTLTLYQD